MHEPVSKNLSMDVCESEYNIVHKNLSQNNSADIPTNVITEMKYDEHIEPSVTDKGSSYFNKFGCDRNFIRSFGCYVSMCMHSITGTTRIISNISSTREIL